MKHFFKVMMLFFFSFNSALGGVVIPSQSANTIDFEAYLDTSSENVSYSEHYRNNHPTSANTELLIEYFEKAQLNYFAKSPGMASDFYKKVISLLEVDDWGIEHRKVIYLSYLRLAEITKNKDYLKSAIQFAPEIKWVDLEISSEQKNELKVLKSNSSNIEWKIQNLKNDFKFILINGHAIEIQKNEKIRISDGQFRVTFLSDKYQPQTFYLNASQIPFLEPARVPFFDGNCKEPLILSLRTELNNVHAFYNSDCIVKVQEGKIAKSDQTFKPELKIHPQEISSFTFEKPFYKKPWFLVAAATLLVGGAIYAVHKNKKSEDPKPEPSREILP